jgi:hypothetical protein
MEKIMIEKRDESLHIIKKAKLLDVSRTHHDDDSIM